MRFSLGSVLSQLTFLFLNLRTEPKSGTFGLLYQGYRFEKWVLVVKQTLSFHGERSLQAGRSLLRSACAFYLFRGSGQCKRDDDTEVNDWQ